MCSHCCHDGWLAHNHVNNCVLIHLQILRHTERQKELRNVYRGAKAAKDVAILCYVMRCGVMWHTETSLLPWCLVMNGTATSVLCEVKCVGDDDGVILPVIQNQNKTSH